MHANSRSTPRIRVIPHNRGDRNAQRHALIDTRRSENRFREPPSLCGLRVFASRKGEWIASLEYKVQFGYKLLLAIDTELESYSSQYMQISCTIRNKIYIFGYIY